jgi:hypothetical protein
MPETNVSVGVAEEVSSVFQVAFPVLGALDVGEGAGKHSMGAVFIASACKTTGLGELLETMLLAEMCCWDGELEYEKVARKSG